ncbi:hypothetical protein BMS3Bbin01_00386 [bacterium BMS3Bbin01]|nr:hypothetical protein BMS3Bbin01_00386 [bacterium BMS3Bbin01]
MAIARFVVQDDAALQGLCHVLPADFGPLRTKRERSCDLESVQCRPGISADTFGERRPSLGLQADARVSQSAFRIGDRPVDQHSKLLGFDLLESEQAGSRHQRGVHFEERVLRGRTHEDDRPVLDAWKESVLLRLRETVDLVEEQHRPSAFLTEPVFGFAQNPSHVFDSGCRRGELLEAGA